MLTIHHLGKSQSERIIWLCEELGVPYELKRYEPRPGHHPRARPSSRRSTRSAPPPSSPRARRSSPNPAPSSTTSSPSTAEDASPWVQDHPDFAHYLYWLHFANGTLQPSMGRKHDPEPAQPAVRQPGAAGDEGPPRPCPRPPGGAAGRGRLPCRQASSPPPTSSWSSR